MECKRYLRHLLLSTGVSSRCWIDTNNLMYVRVITNSARAVPVIASHSLTASKRLLSIAASILQQHVFSGCLSPFHLPADRTFALIFSAYHHILSLMKHWWLEKRSWIWFMLCLIGIPKDLWQSRFIFVVMSLSLPGQQKKHSEKLF